MSPAKKFRSIRRKVRKGFKGIKIQDIRKAEQIPSANASPVQATSPPLTSSAQGPSESGSVADQSFDLDSSFDVIDESSYETRNRSLQLGKRYEKIHPACGFKIIDFDLLKQSLEAAFICALCKTDKTGIDIMVDEKKRKGLEESLSFMCKNCGNETLLQTSKALTGRKVSEVNARSVIASSSMGHARLSDFCGIIGLPPPLAKSSYQQQLKNICKHIVQATEGVLIEASEKLIEITEKEEPFQIQFDDSGRKIANVGVTVDGTWQKRGHSSRIGVVFVMSVRTGAVLDYVIKSKTCNECRCHEKDDKETDQYKYWHENHKSRCEINHEGSSGEMEASGAIEIFLRSIESRGLQYIDFVGDGDSSSFGRVKEALEGKYGKDYEVRKEECVGHIQKRIGTALREFKNKRKSCKLSDGKYVGGKGRLTKVVIDNIQNYYGSAIRNSKGSIDGMKQSIKAIQHHCIINNYLSLEEQHQFCPKDRDTWCKFWKEKLYNDGKYCQDKRLPGVFFEELTPIFQRLSDDALLQRCLKGLTQNQNESLNGQVWTNRCPKTMYCGTTKVKIAVCEAVSMWNTGAASRALLMKSLGIKDLGPHTLKYLRNQNKQRLQNSKRKSSMEFKTKRKALRHKGKKNKKNSDKKSYKAGSFDIDSLPEVRQKKKNKARGATRKQVDDEHNNKRKRIDSEDDSNCQNITFIDEKEIAVLTEFKKKKV